MGEKIRVERAAARVRGMTERRGMMGRRGRRLAREVDTGVRFSVYDDTP
jgi:hypothetical protein